MAQHYVPKMLLRNFSLSKRDEQIYVFDKKRDRCFLTNIKNIVAERGFYDLLVEGIGTISLEPNLSQLETFTANAFERLISHRSLSKISKEDRSWIGTFVAAQHLRAKNLRQMVKELGNAIRKRFAPAGGDPEVTPLDSKSEDDLRSFAVRFFADNIGDYSELMHTKTWSLMGTTKADPFWIGDNPVVMHNDRDFGPYGNIGLAVPGIQIYLPLSPALTLALWCPTLVQQHGQELERAKKRRQTLYALRILSGQPDTSELTNQLTEYNRAIANIEEQMARIATGHVLPCSSDNVTFLNSLQVRWSERFVMSKKPDFSLAKRMISDSEKYRRGVRFTID